MSVRVRPGAHGAAAWLALALTGVAASGCATSEPPRAGDVVGAVPDLQGHRVLVLPVQSVRGVGGPADAELAFALSQRGPRIDWVLPDETREVLGRNPSIQVTPDRLPVGIFQQREVRRIGDPLYGDLRRLAALTDAVVALLPLELRPAPDTLGTGAAGLEVKATLVDIRSGDVFWTAVVAGEPGPASDPRSLASVMDALARALVW